MEKKEAAKLLHSQGVLQKDIATLLHVQPKTVGTWAKDGKWDEKRAQHALAKETSEERVWKLINYQLRIIERITELQEEEGLEDLGVGELKKKLIERGDIDALQKLFTTIKGKELEWTHIVKIIRDFMEHLEQSNIDLAKQVVPLATEFLNERRKEL